jgi:hypothetical protein
MAPVALADGARLVTQETLLDQAGTGTLERAAVHASRCLPDQLFAEIALRLVPPEQQPAERDRQQ